MTAKASAIIRVSFPSRKEIDMVLSALKPETVSSLSKRSKVQVRKEGRTLTLVFESKDTTALRASINSYLSWLHLLNDTYGFLESR